MRLLTVAAFLLVTISAFSGCLFPSDNEDTTHDRIVKKVVVRVDEKSEPEKISDVLQTRFEYTHKGGAENPADLTATYVDDEGDERTEPLTKFTLGTIKDGDIVTIDGVNITSGLQIKKGSSVLAEREGLNVDWLRAQGMELPVSTGEEGVASYVLNAMAGFDITASGFKEEEEDVDVTNAEAHWSLGMDGTTEARTTRPALGPRVEIGAKVHGTTTFAAEVNYVENGTAKNAGGEANLEGWANGTFALQFDNNRNLIKVGGGGDVYADGSIYAWNESHPKSEKWWPEDLGDQEHPLVSEKTDYSEEDVEQSEESPDEELKEFLHALWSMRIGVGDDYRFHAASESEDGEVSLDVIIQVTSREKREVGGGTFDAFRISQSVSLFTKSPQAGENHFDLIQRTFWISEDFYLPLFIQESYTKTFTKGDLQKFYDIVGEEMPATLPQEFTLALTGETTMQLTAYSGDLTISPILGLMGFNFYFPMALGGLGALGASDDDEDGEYQYEPPQAPNITFSLDEANDRLVVLAHGPDAEWTSLRVGVTECTQTSGSGAIGRLGNQEYGNNVNQPANGSGEQLNFPNGEGAVCGDSWPGYISKANTSLVAVNDYLEFCSGPAAADMRNVHVKIEFTMTSETLYEGTFTDWADC